MTEAQVLQLINQFIIANGNNEITANVLRPILVDMLSQPNDKIGELSNLDTQDKSTIVAAINEALSTKEDYFKIHAGSNDPNIVPPESYSIGDWYIMSGQVLFQYNGQTWTANTTIFSGDGEAVLLDDGSSKEFYFFSGLQEWSGDEVIEERGLNDVYRIYNDNIYRLGDVPLPYENEFFILEDWVLLIESGIPISEKGVVGGVATLDSAGKLTASQLPDLVVTQVADISILRGRIGRPGEAVDLLGYYESGDGGGGLFYWDNASTEADNVGTIIEVTEVATGRWKRLFSVAVNVKWFGAKGESTDDTQAIKYAISAAKSGEVKRIYFPPGIYVISETIYLPSFVEIFGDGADTSTLKADNNDLFDLIVPAEHHPAGNPANAEERHKYRAMICTESMDNGGQVESVIINNLGIDWNGASASLNSACSIFIGKALKCEIHHVKLYDAVPLDLSGETQNNTRGCSVMFAFSENCSLHNSTIGAADYESVSVWYISKNTHIYRNVFDGEKSNDFKNQRHLVQTAVTLPPMGFSEIYNAEGVYITENSFLMKQNVGQTITAHGGDGVFIRDNYIKFFDTLDIAWGIKPFSDAKNIEISGNTIDVTDYPYMQAGTTLISTGTSVGAQGVKNCSIHHNEIKIKNNSLFDYNFEGWGVQSIIGSYNAEENENIDIYDNVIKIDGYENAQYPLISCSGNNIKIRNNKIELLNPLEAITENGFSFFYSKGGNVLEITGNNIKGDISKGVEVVETTLGANGLLVDNYFENCIGSEILAPSMEDVKTPAYFDGNKRGSKPEDAIRFDQAIIKLDRDIFYTVGDNGDFHDLADAISQGLEYYPNSFYRITIEIEEGYNIADTLSYEGNNFSHIILTTNNLTITGDYRPFIFTNCLLPQFIDFKMDLSTPTLNNSIGLLIYQSQNLIFSNSTLEGFDNTIWIEQSTGITVENNSLFKPRKGADGRGVRILNTLIRFRESSITTDDIDCESALQAHAGSIFYFQDSIITGSFTMGVDADASIVYIAGPVSDVFNNGIHDHRNVALNRGALVSIDGKTTTKNIKSSVPVNMVTSKGILIDGKGRKEANSVFSITTSENGVLVPFSEIPSLEFKSLLDFSGQHISATGTEALIWNLRDLQGMNGRTLIITNKSSQVLTLNTESTNSNIWDKGNNANTIAVSQGETLELLNDGTEWIVKSKYEGVVKGVYGVAWNKTHAASEVTRIGDMDAHRSLPVHKKMRGCVVDDDGIVNYYLDANNWNFREDGQPALLDGTHGQVMVELPEHYRRFDSEGNDRSVLLSLGAFEGAKHVPVSYIGAFEAAIHRPSGTLASVMNDTADYRGGNNDASRDNGSEFYRDLQKAVTNESRTNFESLAEARGNGWHNFTYQQLKTYYWLMVVEYANRNLQLPFEPQLTADGFRQGGLGDGPTGLVSAEWDDFNGQYPILPIGRMVSLGNQSGEIPITLTDFPSAGESRQFRANSYRGIENPWGHIWKWLSGVNIEVDANGVSRAYVPTGKKESGTDVMGYKLLGVLPSSNGYISDIFFGEDGDILPSASSGSSTTYHSDYFWRLDTEGIRGGLLGGHATHSGDAGPVAVNTNFAPSYSNAYHGSRLAFSPF